MGLLLAVNTAATLKMKMKMEHMAFFMDLHSKDIPDLSVMLLLGNIPFGSIFKPMALHVELAEEGPVIYLNSHFVSHERHRHNPEPRPVRITEDLDSWEEVFRTAWIDLFDDGA